jgi:excisionase family DNA binding protein
LISAQEAAEYLNIKVDTLLRWATARRIEFVKLGRLRKFSLPYLERFIQEHTVPREN